MHVIQKIEIYTLRQSYQANYRIKLMESIKNIRVKENKLLKNKLNLIAIWGKSGCQACKLQMASEFSNYRKNFSNAFSFVYVGTDLDKVKIPMINTFLTMQVDTLSEIFEKSFEIRQPIIFLANSDGEILMIHQMIVGDKKKFQRFSKEVFSLFKILNE